MSVRAARRSIPSPWLVVSLVALAGEAQAFSTQGFKWANGAGSAITYMLEPGGAPDVTGDADLLAVRRAFSTWQAVSCSFATFAEVPWAEPRTVATDNKNQVFWTNSSAEWPADQQGTLALTFTFYDTANNTIIDADMVMNAVYWEWTTVEAELSSRRVDVETVVFHEIGHFFGLSHSQDSSAAMFPSNNKGIQRTPAPDDVNGICTLYPNGEPTPGGGGTKGSVGAACQSNADCTSLLCAEDRLINKNYCTAPCTGDPSVCPSGLICAPTQGGESYCLAPAPVDELCDQCNNSSQCATGLCLNVPGYNFFQSFCTRACDPTPGAASCPQGYRCETTTGLGQTGGVCVPQTGVCDPSGKGGHNEPCFSNDTCKPNHVCAEYFAGSGLKFCYAACPFSARGQPCTLNTPGFICDSVAGKTNTGACYNVVNVGEPCVPEICAPGTQCLFDENVGVNTAVCYAICENQDQCPVNTACEFFESLGYGVCSPRMGFRYLGQSCASDEECSSRVCRTFGQSQLCTQACSAADEASCPAGLKCVPTGDVVAGFCWPESISEGTSEDLLREIRERKDDGQGPGYCSCDTTSACDPDCACDPECGGGCGCREVAGEASVLPMLLALLGLAAGRRRVGALVRSSRRPPRHGCARPR